MPAVNVHKRHKPWAVIKAHTLKKMHETLANAAAQYKSCQLAPAVLHTAHIAQALSMARCVTREGACQTPTLLIVHSMGTCMCLNGRKCGRQTQAMQCAPLHHTCPAPPPPGCAHPRTTPHTAFTYNTRCDDVGRKCGQFTQLPQTATDASKPFKPPQQRVR